MKKLILIPLMFGLITTPLYAGHDRHRGDRAVYYDRARVINVKPVVEIIEIPVEDRECWTEEVSGNRYRNNAGAGMVVGSIIGGVLGHQMGRGHGQGAATVAGTVIGAAVGNEMGKKERHQPYTHTERHCRVTESYQEEERVIGYRVTYRFRGELFTSEMDHDPGKFVRLRVKLIPID